LSSNRPASGVSEPSELVLSPLAVLMRAAWSGLVFVHKDSPSSEVSAGSARPTRGSAWSGIRLVAAAQVTAAFTIFGMATRLVQINMKAHDASALGRFWAEALGWAIDSEEPVGTSLEPVGFAYPDPAAVCIDLIARPEPKTVKNRVHLDLATTSAAHQAELVARLKELGATPADVGQGDVPWTVMADPEGNEFCVLEPRPIYQDTGPIAAVVVDCTDPRAMARFWGEAMDWTLHEVTDDHAVMRSAKAVIVDSFSCTAVNSNTGIGSTC
jgi:predicted enzyme related to lactoylglutathione lyase